MTIITWRHPEFKWVSDYQCNALSVRWLFWEWHSSQGWSSSYLSLSSLSWAWASSSHSISISIRWSAHYHCLAGDCFGNGALLRGGGSVNSGKALSSQRWCFFYDDFDCDPDDVMNNYLTWFPQRMWPRRWVKLSQPAWTWVQWSTCEEQSCQFCKWTSVASFEKLWQTFPGSKNIFSGLCCCFTMTIPSSWLPADLNPRWVRVLILVTASNEANLDTTEYKCGLNVDDQIWCKCIRIRAAARWKVAWQHIRNTSHPIGRAQWWQSHKHL